MKNIFFQPTLLAFILVVNTGMAQTSDPVEKISSGSQFIGGNFSFNVSTTKNDFGNSSAKNTNKFFEIGPEFGMYFKDNLAWSSSISYLHEKVNEASSSEISSNGVGLSFFLIKNYRIINNLFFELRPELNGNFSVRHNESLFIDDKNRSIGFGLGLSPGLLVFLNKNIALRTSVARLGYSYRRTKTDNNNFVNQNHNFGFNGDLTTLNFSVRYFVRFS